MAGLQLIEPTELYNLLNQGLRYPCLSDPNYLLLLDAREKDEYEESHIITSKIAPKHDDGVSYRVPYDAELECKVNLIVYDSNTSSLKDDGPAMMCAKVMWDMGSRNRVKILTGGYEDFSALYPFLRTQTIIYMPRELDDIKTYPIEVIPGLLYLGNWRQGNAAYIQKDIKVKGHVNCCVEIESFFKEEGEHLVHIPIENVMEADLRGKFESICSFIDGFKERGEVCLVFSQLATSRAPAIVLAYLMHHKTCPLKEAHKQLTACSTDIQPHRGFIEQLSQWEKFVLGGNVTDISDCYF